MKNGVSRRQFLGRASTLAAGSAAAALLPRAARATPAHERFFQFRYSEVKLTGGPLKAQFDRIHRAYLNLDEDRLLKVYRQRAGLAAPGEDMGGWYDAQSFAPGHSFGQYVSGLARFAAATGDEATRAKVKRLVEGFAATVAADGYCYASEKASTTFPAYIFDKHAVGLLDADQYAGVPGARELLERVTRGAVKYLPPRAIDRNLEPLKQAPYDESYTLGENLFMAWEVTGRNEYLELAKKYLLDSTYFDPLSRGENVFPGRHAYSHANALSSAARAYQILGEPKYLEAIRNAWNMIEQTQQFASGGWGPNETFVEPHRGKLRESLEQTHAHFETPCGAYAHFKLARYLLRFSADARYGDGLERVLYNTILGAWDPKGDGHFFYYSDYHPSTQKTFFPDKWPCCSGTLPQAVADYVISAYFQNSDGILVNLFAPSEVSWKFEGMPVRLIQATSYPQLESTELRLELPSPATFTVWLRIPGWLESPAQISVNGKTVSEPAGPRTFAAVRRRWTNNDTVELKLPFSVRAVAIDDGHLETVALMRGPLMLVALGPHLRLERKSVTSSEGLKPVPGAPQTFEVQAPAEKPRFAPFYLVGDARYTAYWEMT